jgi:hypothetical protein
MIESASSDSIRFASGLAFALCGVLVSQVAIGAPSRSPDEIRNSLQKVYAREEFSGSRVNALERIGQWISQYFRWLGELGSRSPLLFWILLVGCVGSLILLLAHLAWTIRRSLSAGVSLSNPLSGPSKHERLSSTYWEEALRMAGQSEFTEAIRCLFLSLVYRFDESGRVNFLRAYTNREYLSLFADRPEVQSALRVFVDTLDDCWYGQRAANRARYQDCLARYEGLK